jgi:uncharacterized membrane protein
VLWGWILFGWGVFNLVEGIIDHHILGIHHVISGAQQALANVLFLVLGAALITGGWLLQKFGKPVGAAAEGPDRSRQRRG